MSQDYLDCEYTIGVYCGQDKLIWKTLELLKEQQEEIKDLRQTCQSMMEGIVVSSK